ncbi:MAG: glycosyltransferase family 4 protein [Bacteroidia bacterium]|nr:glycosyltransferase family 4 protein [Bacteroidia bacterium]
MKVHVVSESMFVMKGTGVHTAFLDHVQLLREKDDIEVVVNGEGWGDVFHSHTYFLYYLWKGRKYKGRRVFTAHVIPESIKGSFPLWKLFYPFVRWGLKTVYQYADVCIAISPMVEKAIRETGADTRIVKIYNPINTEIWKRTEEKRIEGRKILGISNNDYVVLGVGQLQGRKGVEDFLDIADTIPEARFVWAGGRPFGVLTEGMIRINERFRKAGPNVIQAGQIELERMPLIYAASDLMIFPSNQETFGLAPLEAAASGIPVIFKDIEVYKLLYKNPYLKASTTEQFAVLIKRMMNDKNFYEEGLSISNKLLTQFDKNKIREEFISLYKSLLLN